MPLSKVKNYLIPMGALVVGTAVTFLQSAETNKKIRLKRVSSSPEHTTEYFGNCGVPIQDKHAHMLFQQAFDDLQFKGDVYFYPYVNYFNSVGALSSYSPKAYNALIVTSEKMIMNHSPEELYAIAAHEAIHIKHHHALIGNIMSSYMYLGLPLAFFKATQKMGHFMIPEKFSNLSLVKAPLFIVMCCSLRLSWEVVGFLCSQMDKLFEMDADITASMQLGVASQLIDILSKDQTLAPEDKNYFEDRSTHPRDETRIGYLSWLKNTGICKTPTLFQSKTYQRVIAEQSQQTPNSLPRV